jgi:hypothetical protein
MFVELRGTGIGFLNLFTLKRSSGEYQFTYVLLTNFHPFLSIDLFLSQMRFLLLLITEQTWIIHVR